MSASSGESLQIINMVEIGTGAFPLFTKLPPEIRSMIWTQSLCHERFIRVELLLGRSPQDLLDEDRPDYYTRLDAHILQELDARSNHRARLDRKNSFLVVLRNRHEISKLFRVCSESRQSAMGFYRVKVPCYYKQLGEYPTEGTFYFNPELDFVDIVGLKFLPRFANTLLANDPRHVGLINLGCVWRHARGYYDPLFQPIEGDEHLVRQLLSRLRRVIFGYNGHFGRGIQNRMAQRYGWKPQLHRSRPILASVSKFQRLPQDPRSVEAELTKTFLGYSDPRDQMYRWFRLLEHWQIEYPNHRVDYRYMVAVNNTRVTDRDEALFALREEKEEWNRCQEAYVANGVPCEEDGDELASAYGFWLFPINAFGRIPKANNRIRHIGRSYLESRPRVWKFGKAWDVSKESPELCLQYLPKVPLSEPRDNRTTRLWMSPKYRPCMRDRFPL
ncbi:hypothetical protein VB005_08293 [Metarhizium brunneum]